MPGTGWHRTVDVEIGAALHLSPDTARTYVSRLLHKLNARDRAQLVVIAYESGLCAPATAEPLQRCGAIRRTGSVSGSGAVARNSTSSSGPGGLA